MGMNAQTGKQLTGVEHLRQSVHSILLTPLGSRVMRRDFGSLIFELLDRPGNEANQLKLAAAGVDALLRHEPRMVPTRFQLDGGDFAAGEFSFAIEGVTTADLEDLPAGSAVHLSIPVALS